MKTLLIGLEPILKKRKPKPCKEEDVVVVVVVVTNEQFDWPDDLTILLKEIKKKVSKYKFKDAEKSLVKLSGLLST
ncbi:MAG: hypothetical protein HOC24_02180 [Deltaproteobacteria bacterium]|nr:hypothetical protein [Deltaproteobacteria bacterium]